jgi:hypothetical protein
LVPDPWFHFHICRNCFDGVKAASNTASTAFKRFPIKSSREFGYAYAHSGSECDQFSRAGFEFRHISKYHCLIHKYCHSDPYLHNLPNGYTGSSERGAGIAQGANNTPSRISDRAIAFLHDRFQLQAGGACDELW